MKLFGILFQRQKLASTWEKSVGWGCCWLGEGQSEKAETNFVPELGAIQSKGCSSSYHQSTRNNKHPRAQILFSYILGEQTYQPSISDRIRRYLFRYYWKVIWNFTRDSLLACQLYDILTISNQSNVGKHRPRGFAAIAVFLFLPFCCTGQVWIFAACSENCDPFKLHLSTGRLLEFTRNTRKLFLAPLHTLAAPKSGSRWDPLGSTGIRGVSSAEQGEREAGTGEIT